MLGVHFDFVCYISFCFLCAIIINSFSGPPCPLFSSSFPLLPHFKSFRLVIFFSNCPPFILLVCMVLSVGKCLPFCCEYDGFLTRTSLLVPILLWQLPTFYLFFVYRRLSFVLCLLFRAPHGFPLRSVMELSSFVNCSAVPSALFFLLSCFVPLCRRG